MEAAHSSETSVYLYQTIWHYTPEDIFFSQHHESLESHSIYKCFIITVKQCFIGKDLSVGSRDYVFINCDEYKHNM